MGIFPTSTSSLSWSVVLVGVSIFIGVFIVVGVFEFNDVFIDLFKLSEADISLCSGLLWFR